MELIILDTDLEPISYLEEYESFIWTDRYFQYGDFELYAAIHGNILNIARQDFYLQNRDSEHVMIIEKLHINSDVEEGNHITITGRSLESILERRIVWGQRSLSGNLQKAVKALLDEAIISPSDPARQISNFIFETSTDSAITGLTIDAQYTGDNLYEVIKTICEESGIGFKITLNDDKQFVFSLYAGTDRSYNQSVNSYVVFSPKFENIINSNYIESKSSLKTVTLIGGEGEGASRKYATVGIASTMNTTGLNRRELFTDARDISSDVGDGVILTDDEYTAKLIQRGKEKLIENVEVISFEGQVETTMMFRYGEDFFDGDIVQIENEYGHSASARIVEIVMSDDEQGTSVYPTFNTFN